MHETFHFCSNKTVERIRPWTWNKSIWFLMTSDNISRQCEEEKKSLEKNTLMDQPLFDAWNQLFGRYL